MHVQTSHITPLLTFAIKNSPPRKFNIIMGKNRVYTFDKKEKMYYNSKTKTKAEFCMKVILLLDVKGTGKKGDVVEVSDGFARNMLFKKNLAKPATAVEVNSLKIKKDAEEFHKREEIKRLTELSREINGKEVLCLVKAGEAGKIFGSVTNENVAAALEKIGYAVDKKKIVLSSPIKQLGFYDVEIKLISGIPCKIKLKVDKE